MNKHCIPYSESSARLREEKKLGLQFRRFSAIGELRPFRCEPLGSSRKKVFCLVTREDISNDRKYS